MKNNTVLYNFLNKNKNFARILIATTTLITATTLSTQATNINIQQKNDYVAQADIPPIPMPKQKNDYVAQADIPPIPMPKQKNDYVDNNIVYPIPIPKPKDDKKVSNKAIDGLKTPQISYSDLKNKYYSEHPVQQVSNNLVNTDNFVVGSNIDLNGLKQNVNGRFLHRLFSNIEEHQDIKRMNYIQNNIYSLLETRNLIKDLEIKENMESYANRDRIENQIQRLCIEALNLIQVLNQENNSLINRVKTEAEYYQISQYHNDIIELNNEFREIASEHNLIQHRGFSNNSWR